MIRFSCPKCEREYLLADALAHLPLLCKGCGQQLNVPEPSPEPEPPPPPPPPQQKKKFVPPPPDEDDEPLFESPPQLDNDSSVDLGGPLSPEMRRPTLLRPPPAAPRPAPPPVRSKPAGGRKGLGVAVDAAVALILVAAGVFLGEMVAQKSTREVMASATGPKFPPLDLLMWLAPPVVLLLVYMLLGLCGKTLGAWLRKRAA